MANTVAKYCPGYMKECGRRMQKVGNVEGKFEINPDDLFPELGDHSGPLKALGWSEIYICDSCRAYLEVEVRPEDLDYFVNKIKKYTKLN